MSWRLRIPSIPFVLLLVFCISAVLRRSAVTAEENHESKQVQLSEETVSDFENKPKFVESEELDSLPKRQFKTAEIADAVMGTETPIDRSDIESLFPKKAKESSFSPHCDENSDQCVSPAQDEDLELLQEEDSESMQQVTDDFISKISHMMDKIAPPKVKTVSSKNKSQWRINPLVCNEKRECRHAERKWRETRLQVHYEIYKEILNKYQATLKGARDSFFSGIIHRNINNARTLFATVERLTNPPVTVPPELNSTMACNDVATFFTEKILNIRRSISTSVQTPIPTMSPINTHPEKMTHNKSIKL